jgi:hypothetical protein
MQLWLLLVFRSRHEPIRLTEDSRVDEFIAAASVARA